MRNVFLSHALCKNTPSYGKRNLFSMVKKSSIAKGDVSNDSSIETTVHIGTHIDMPYHFYENGQTICDYGADFWFFSNPLFLEINPVGLIIHGELILALLAAKQSNYDILIVKTGIGYKRNDVEFWEKNYGFHPEIYDFLIVNFPSLRVFGFDSISVSSFSNRELGREAHKRFLNPKQPILLLEDMNLTNIDSNTELKSVIVSPLRIEDCDGLPCTVFGQLND